MAAEFIIHMDWEVPEMSHNRPCCCDVLEGKPFVFISVEDRVRIQIQLLTTILEAGGQLWVLEDFWTLVGKLIGNEASTSDFNCSQKHISVSSRSIFSFVA